MNEYKTNIISKKELTGNVLEIRLNKPQNFDFSAGQFIQLHANDGAKAVLRSYSLSSTPKDIDIELCVKIYETGVASQLLKKTPEGGEISFRGPAGRFTHDATNEKLLFIATGVGLAPIMGMIRDELENKKNQNNIHLVFGVRYEKDIFWTNRLDELQKKYQNFTYSITLSQPEDSWSGLRGRVTEHLPADTSDLHAFLCGSAEMVKTVREMLMTQGTGVQKIHFEIF